MIPTADTVKYTSKILDLVDGAKNVRVHHVIDGDLLLGDALSLPPSLSYT